MKENEIFANQVSLNMNGDTLEIYVDDRLAAEISDGRLDWELAYDVLEGMGHKINEDNYAMRPLFLTEKKYAYEQHYGVSAHCGFVGKFDAFFDEEYGLMPQWKDFREKLTPKEFSLQAHSIIRELSGRDRFLSSEHKLMTYCLSSPEISFGDDKEYGIRLDTKNYSYLMRFNLYEYKSKVHIYCYEKATLDRHMTEAEKGIRLFSKENRAFTIPDGDWICIVLNTGKRLARDCRYCDGNYFIVGDKQYNIRSFEREFQNEWSSVFPLRSSLPEQSYVYIKSQDEIGAIRKGKSGYYRINILGGTPSERNALVDEMNRKQGVSKAQAEAMKAGSMFGWDTPAADPKSYNENGFPVKPKKSKDYER